MSISSQSRKHEYLLIFQECAECRTGHKRIDEHHFCDVFRVASRNFAAVSHSEEGFIFDNYRRNPGTNTAVIQMLRQSDSRIFKRYNQAKLYMTREALAKLDRNANDHHRTFGTPTPN